MKSDKVDSGAKVAPRPTSLATGLIRLLRKNKLLAWAVARNLPSLFLESLLRSVHF